MHFDKGRDHERAVEYRYRAAQNALQRSAHREAIDHLMKGLQLVADLPDTAERRQRELTLQIVLGVPLTATKGYAAPEVERAYGRALELSEQVSETSQIAQALLGLWVFYALRADLQTAHRLAERSLRHIQRLHAADLALDAHNALGTILLWLGVPARARRHLEQGLALHHARQQRTSVLHDLTDPGVACLSNLSWALWHLGYPDQALKRSEEALTLARDLAQPYSLSYALNFRAALHCFRREERQTQEQAEATIAVCREQEFPFYLATGTILRSWALVQRSRGQEELSHMHQGLAAFQAIGAQLSRTAFLALLAESYGKSGRLCLPVLPGPLDKLRVM